ncbi:hypothetical protein DYB35_012378 [Aphanomyces astaci]|uniref:PHTF1/2 N-terminal domain-containing protein n=1 Tax=Aphanomyces astaci TaxID=112090 RepID=A0A3R7EI83_APHAT|nr:hypothetical protein DYB35_012378 [Aphanomyces astaci]
MDGGIGEMSAPSSPLKAHHRSRKGDKRESPSRQSSSDKKSSKKPHDLPQMQFIDFDVIKGYDHWFYAGTTAVYVVHLVATAMYLADVRNEPAPLTSFEIWTPVVLLILTACGYGRVSSIVLSADPEGSLSLNGQLHGINLHSPLSTPLAAASKGRGPPPRDHTHAPVMEAVNSIDPSLLESEGSSGESGGSDSDGGASSSSEDEVPKALDEHDDVMPFPHSVESKRFIHPICNQLVKEAMSITELRNHILLKVKSQPPRHLYRTVARLSGCLVALVPLLFRVLQYFHDQHINIYDPYVLYEAVPSLVLKTSRLPLAVVVAFIQNHLCLESLLSVSCTAATYIMGSVIFSALADAEVTYHRRFLYAKCFTALTSSRRSKASHLPHFRLKNVVNIKAWLSLRGGRSWLKRQGRQRAADEIVSTSFLIVLLFLAVMGVQAVSETMPNTTSHLSTVLHTEVTVWCLLSSVFLLRFMMLGSNINRKYQNTSLLLTEQMNVYLKLLVTPEKKEKLLISNNVLKLASKLLKELNSPNKISGLTMNPLLYNVTRVVVLSAFSSALSEVFGFKLKLWKMKV